MSVNRRLIRDVRNGLSSRADPAKAPKMQAYMKSSMPYYGVQASGQEAVFKQVFGNHLLKSEEDWRETALMLWRGARFREERYAAIALTGWRPYQDFQSMKGFGMYEEMIVEGAWWDYVDAVAIHRIGGPLLEKYPSRIPGRMTSWSKSPNLWKRRTSIICQVARKKETDLALLYTCVENNLADRDFFIRKAIGWALRAYAWVDPKEVVRYVDLLGSDLSPLSRREALKNVGARSRQRLTPNPS